MFHVEHSITVNNVLEPHPYKPSPSVGTPSPKKKPPKFNPVGFVFAWIGICWLVAGAYAMYPPAAVILIGLVFLLMAVGFNERS